MQSGGKSLDIRFGDFACSISGYDDPAKVLRRVLRTLHDLAEDHPEMTGLRIELTESTLSALEAELAGDTPPADAKIMPSLHVLRSPEAMEDAPLAPLPTERFAEDKAAAAAAAAAAVAWAAPQGEQGDAALEEDPWEEAPAEPGFAAEAAATEAEAEFEPSPETDPQGLDAMAPLAEAEVAALAASTEEAPAVDGLPVEAEVLSFADPEMVEPASEDGKDADLWAVEPDTAETASLWGADEAAQTEAAFLPELVWSAPEQAEAETDAEDAQPSEAMLDFPQDHYNTLQEAALSSQDASVEPTDLSADPVMDEEAPTVAEMASEIQEPPAGDLIIDASQVDELPGEAPQEEIAASIPPHDAEPEAGNWPAALAPEEPEPEPIPEDDGKDAEADKSSFLARALARVLGKNGGAAGPGHAEEGQDEYTDHITPAPEERDEPVTLPFTPPERLPAIEQAPVAASDEPTPVPDAASEPEPAAARMPDEQPAVQEAAAMEAVEALHGEEELRPAARTEPWRFGGAVDFGASQDQRPSDDEPEDGGFNLFVDPPAEPEREMSPEPPIRPAPAMDETEHADAAEAARPAGVPLTLEEILAESAISTRSDGFRSGSAEDQVTSGFGGPSAPEPSPVANAPAEAAEVPAETTRADTSTPAYFVEVSSAETVPDLLAAAAAYLTLGEGRARFTRREVMDVFDALPGDQPRTLEARIKGFGRLVREGTLVLVEDGVFAMSHQARARFE